ncbi:MAG: cellulase family glycosylhydrolase, partial [Armatimonadota bacterium]
ARPLAPSRPSATATHGQSAQATVAVAEGREGARGLAVHYDFSGRDGLEYVDLAGEAPLGEDVQSLGLWMRGGEHRLPVNVRILDQSGECFQFNLGQLTPGEWTLGVCDLSGGGHWGGDDNGKLDPPLRLTSIIFDRQQNRFKGTGDLQIGQLGVYRKLTSRMQPHGLTLSLPQAQDMLVYEPGQAVTVRLQADLTDPTLPPLPLALTARLVDPFGQVVQTASVKLASADPVPFTLTPPTAGAFDLQFRLPGEDNDLDAPWADLRFAVLPTPLADGAKSPFGVCTHFGQGGAAASLMPLIARAGITYYRDEIYWGGVEQEKGKLAIPDGCRAWVKLGKQLGLEPLIIVDYSNGVWEPTGDFPIHTESRAAFARYAGFLAQQLPEIQHFEIWNEWTGGCGMNGRTGTAADYAPVFLESAKAIRQANPQAQVVGIGGEWDWAQFGPMMSGGAGAAMDAATIHPYMYPGLPGQPFGEHLRKAGAETLVAAGKPLPVWITEIGWPTQRDGRGSSFLHQARCLVRMMTTALASDVRRVFWYDFKDDGTDLIYNESNFGMVHHDSFALAPKPAYVAYAHLIRAVHGRKCGGWERSKDFRSVRFTGDRDTLSIVWMDEESKTVQFKLPPKARVEDMFGRPVKAVSTIPLTQDPVFVFAPR